VGTADARGTARLPAPGGDAVLGHGPVGQLVAPARLLWRLRWRLGALLGWDREGAGIGTRVPTLRARMAPGLRGAPTGPAFAALPFTSLYQLEDEWAAEMANRTVHTVMHIGWVPDGAGGHRGQMAVLVKPNGLFGRVYMALIAPLRHRVVYPTMLAAIGRRWRTVTGEAAPPAG
jgi:hypothetical protein